MKYSILDNFGNTIPGEIINNVLSISKECITHPIEYLDVVLPDNEASVGDEGYYIIADKSTTGSFLCHFTEKPDQRFIQYQKTMPIFGVKKQDHFLCGIATGMKYEFCVHVGVQNGRYFLNLRFILGGDIPYEDFEIKFFELGSNADYNDMAHFYRNYQLENNNCRPLFERIKSNEELQYATESIEIRIRLGWKPVPPQILDQTNDNEPEMKVACDFDRVKDFITELKRQGVDKAEICLVGWNISGHDGRFPQLFPVEERLGGEKKLRELIDFAKKNGYQIVGHTNSTDAYSIADCFCEDIVAKRKDGSLSVNKLSWSGGTMYNVCPIKSLELTKKLLPAVSDLGFRGIHYIDCITTLSLYARKCYDPNHFVTPKIAAKMYCDIMKLSHDLFGGFSSEGGFDFAAKYLDYCYYASYEKNKDSFFDTQIPLWQMVYHGIILYNPYPSTVNYPIKPISNKLEVLEFGGRPTFYLYSDFIGNNKQNKVDLVCDTDEQLKNTVQIIKKEYEEYKNIRHLQTEFIEHYKKTDTGSIITYSDGSKIEVDYKNETYNIC